MFLHSEARKEADAEKQKRNDRFFKLGPSDSPFHERTLSIVTFGAVSFASATTKEQHSWILDPSKKPKSTDPREAVVYVVNRCGTFRNEAFLELAETLDMKIHQNPKCPKRNSNFDSIPKEDWTRRDSYFENWKLYSKYKYCLVIENTVTSEDITEKIFPAFMGGCIPIYWGSKDVWNVFNLKAFVFYDMDHPNEALEEIKRLKDNDTAY